MAPSADPELTVLKRPQARPWQLSRAMNGHDSLLASDFPSRP